MLETMHQFGQILPVAVVKGLEPNRHELIDGFKPTASLVSKPFRRELSQEYNPF